MPPCTNRWEIVAFGQDDAACRLLLLLNAREDVQRVVSVTPFRRFASRHAACCPGARAVNRPCSSYRIRSVPHSCVMTPAAGGGAAPGITPSGAVHVEARRVAAREAVFQGQEVFPVCGDTVFAESCGASGMLQASSSAMGLRKLQNQAWLAQVPHSARKLTHFKFGLLYGGRHRSARLVRPTREQPDQLNQDLAEQLAPSHRLRRVRALERKPGSSATTGRCCGRRQAGV